MKIKTILIITASLLAVGAFIGMHSGSCPMKNSKPCEWFSK